MRIDLGSTSQYDVYPEMVHAKFGVDRTCGFGGVNSEWLVSFRDFAQKIEGRNGRGLYQEIQLHPLYIYMSPKNVVHVGQTCDGGCVV